MDTHTVPSKEWIYIFLVVVVKQVYDRSIPLSLGPPSRPSKPSVEKGQLNTFRLTSIVESAGSGPITHCIVNVTSNSASWRLVNVTATVSSARQVQVTVTVLDRTVVYRFSMAAGGPYGHGEFSDLSDPQALGLYFVCVLVFDNYSAFLFYIHQLSSFFLSLNNFCLFLILTLSTISFSLPPPIYQPSFPTPNSPSLSNYPHPTPPLFPNTPLLHHPTPTPTSTENSESTTTVGQPYVRCVFILHCFTNLLL